MSEPGKAVFLSYASQDAEAAKRICDALRTAGVEVWFDQSELVGGDAWDAKIRGQISSCALFMPMVSANTQARREGYFRIEWRLAAQRTHAMSDDTTFLLPVVIDDTRDVDAKVPAEFKLVQWTRLPGGETPPAFVTRVKKLLSEEPGAGSAETESRQPRTETRRRGLAKWWWALPIFGVMMALLLVLKEGRKERAPPPAAPAVASVNTEIARLRAGLRPDEWTRADFDALVQTIDRMIQDHPDNGDAWALRGVANSLLVIRNLDSGTKPLEVGKEAADRALRLAPKSPLAELALGLHLTAMISRGSDVHAPRLHIERGLAGLPATEALSRYADVTSYWLGYQLEGTEKSSRAWLAAEPSASFPAWILAQSAVAGRRAAEAVKWSEQAAADPDITGVRSFVTLFEARYYLQADLAAARAAVDRVPGGQRGVHRVIAARFLVAMAEKHFDQALQELAQTPEAMLRDRVFHGPKALLAGFAHQAAGRTEVAWGFFQDAEKLLREELARDRDNFELRAVLALNLACLGRAEEARRELAVVEPLLAGREPSVYTRQPVALIAQTHGVMGEIDLMIPWLRRLITEPSGMPFTPASLRLDSRFGPYTIDSRMEALLKEFSGLDQPAAAGSDSSSAKATEDWSGKASLPDPKSVAVLAFANLSDDKANEYFSDGISEELLNVLAKIPGLKVSARTSAFYFKGKDTPVPEIARQLGVAYVVEGSVRKAGDKVRITAQLIKAADGFHVWSDTFTRDLKDVFAVQDEIAGLIAQNLRAKMAVGRERSAMAPEAYALVLQARHATAAQTVEGRHEAVKLYREALALAPDAADAWAELAYAYQYLARFGGLDTGEGMREARTAARKALELDPEQPLALAAFGWVQRTDDHDWRGAVQSFRHALTAAPENVNVMSDAAICFLNVGRSDEAATLATRATERDPLNPQAFWTLGIVRAFTGDLALAEAPYRRAIELAPTADEYHSHLARVLTLLNRLDEAKALALAEHSERYRLVSLAGIYFRSGDAAAGTRALDDLAAKYGDEMAGYIAAIWAQTGNRDEAFKWLERAYERRDSAVAWSKTSKFLENLTADPRWPVFLRKLGLADDQLK